MLRYQLATVHKTGTKEEILKKVQHGITTLTTVTNWADVRVQCGDSFGTACIKGMRF